MVSHGTVWVRPRSIGRLSPSRSGNSRALQQGTPAACRLLGRAPPTSSLGRLVRGALTSSPWENLGAGQAQRYPHSSQAQGARRREQSARSRWRLPPTTSCSVVCCGHVPASVVHGTSPHFIRKLPAPLPSLSLSSTPRHEHGSRVPQLAAPRGRGRSVHHWELPGNATRKLLPAAAATSVLAGEAA